ncbi:prolipoprotein diacylglyceryl transferase [Mycobacterium sp. AMU20-3851]|uniref:prolipoprotein diacylglyceryl transferase n=1 Tax=Mycobacterium sp. AMU20-3851 TaxID=3122055 RepID=UPI003754D578
MTVTTLAYIPSPAQGVWYLGPVPLRAYALCIIVGIVAALVIGDRRWEARGGERGVIYDIALWAVPFGLVGGRLYHVLTDWPTYFGAGGAGLGAAFRIWDGGLGIWGAVALGAVGAWIACRRRGIPLPAFGDAIAPGIILAQAVGRLGNYFNQELFGRATDLPWGLEIYERVDAAGFRDTLNGVSTGKLVAVVHPTFLYELLWNLLVFALLIWADRRFKLGHGRVFALYVAGYCLGRFWIELMRSDTATLIAGIRVNSFTATFVFIAAVVYIMAAPKGREDPATLRGNAPTEPAAGAEEPATEVIAVGAVTGVVAAATVAGADEDEGTASSLEPDIAVADAAEEADEVEEAVETEVLATTGNQEAAGSAEAELADVLDAEEQAAEEAGTEEVAAEAEAEALESEARVTESEARVTEADEPETRADEDTTAAEDEAEPEAELADVLDAEEEAAEEAELEEAAEAEAEAEAEELEAEADDTAEAEPEAEPVDALAAAEEAEAEALEAEAEPEPESADVLDAEEEAELEESAAETEAEAEAEELEAEADDTAEAEPEAEPADALAAAEEPEAEEIVAEVLESVDAATAEAEDVDGEELEEAAAESETETETEEPAAEEVEAESGSAAEESGQPVAPETPAATPAATGKTSRRPRWFRRKG